MAESIIVTCPECGDKFKSLSDKEGKKIRCPECDELFRLTARMISYPKGSKAPRKPKASEEITANPLPQVEVEAEQPVQMEVIAESTGDFDEEDANPYDLKHVQVKNRCPACAKEMPDEK